MKLFDTGFNLENDAVQKHIFAVTTMPQKLRDTLKVVEVMFETARVSGKSLTYKVPSAVFWKRRNWMENS